MSRGFFPRITPASVAVFAIVVGHTPYASLVTSARAQSSAGVQAVPSDVRVASQAFWDRYLTKCGNTYYQSGWNLNAIVLVKFDGVAFRFLPYEPTTAERKNGVLWKGETVFTAKTEQSREKLPDAMYLRDKNRGAWSGWGDWKDVTKAGLHGGLPGGWREVKNEVVSVGVVKRGDGIHFFDCRGDCSNFMGSTDIEADESSKFSCQDIAKLPEKSSR